MLKRFIINKQIKFISNDVQSGKVTSQSLKSQSLKSQSIKSQSLKSDQLKDDQNYVSNTHPKSMLRFYKVKQPKDETDYERQYRLKYEQIQLWNHNYWLKNNEQFQLGKKQFKINLKQSIAADEQHQQEQLLPFYKNFLDSNHKRNITYNMEWYKKNLGLLIPAIQANLSRLIKNFKLPK